MNVLFYTPKDTLVSQRLEKKIRGVVPNPNLEIFPDFDSFRRRLRAPVYNLAAAVLFTETSQNLDRLATVSDLLTGIRMILVLPDHSPETVRAGHRMQPRFVSFTDSDFSDVAGVLEKMWQLTAGDSRLSRRAISGNGKGRSRSGGSNT